MEVKNMDEATRNMKVAEARTWLENNDAGIKNTILSSIVDGLEAAITEDEMDDMWTAYRSTAHTVEVDNVKVFTMPVKKGRKQNPILAGSLNVLEPMLLAAFEELVNNHPIISAITLPTARSGGVYTQQELIAELVRSNLDSTKRTFYAERWDGTLNKNDLPTITPNPVVEKDDEEESSEDV
tara:strand:- start:584 stop:1129 length:546 start_codon:yes stop_codon:yes gene_type:complete